MQEDPAQITYCLEQLIKKLLQRHCTHIPSYMTDLKNVTLEMKLIVEELFSGICYVVQ